MVDNILMPTMTSVSLLQLRSKTQKWPLDFHSTFYLIAVLTRLKNNGGVFFTALFHLIWSQGQDLHDDVQAVAECAAGQGERIRPASLWFCMFVWKVMLTQVVRAASFLTLIGRRLLQPLCPKELWHFVHQCYGNELGLTSDDEDYVPPDDDFNTMGWVYLFADTSCYGYHYKHRSDEPKLQNNWSPIWAVMSNTQWHESMHAVSSSLN